MFNDPTTYDEKVIKKLKTASSKSTQFLIELIEKISPLQTETNITNLEQKADIQFGVIMQSLRLAIVGNLTGPDIFSVCGLLEKEVTLWKTQKINNLFK